MKKLLIILTVLALGLTTSLQAQTIVTISFNSAADQTLNVNESGKLYFNDNYLFVDEGNGIPYSFLLSAISKMTFSAPSSIEDIETPELKIYPNPVSQNLYVHHNQQERSLYSLFSYDGRLLLQGSCSNDEPIDMSRYSRGLYLIQVDGITFKISKL